MGGKEILGGLRRFMKSWRLSLDFFLKRGGFFNE